MAPMMSRSPIITERGNTMIKNGMRPVHPGEILLDGFMKPAVPLINANMLAKALDVPANRITGRFQVPSATGEGWRSCA